MAAQQSSWSPPTRKSGEPVLKVYNSFTKSKTEFLPADGRHVKWYNCGPTVYDASHMGHARNYVTQDVLRRIMTDYFKYDVHFVMNITDIEDKIIQRARHNHLLDRLRSQSTSLTASLISETRLSWAAYVLSKVAKGLPETDLPSPGQESSAWPALSEKMKDKAWRAECLKRDEKFEMHFNSANRTFEALKQADVRLANGEIDLAAAHALIDAGMDVLAVSLDEQFKTTVTDHSIFRALTAHWEAEFFKDMRRLRVRDPDTLTRVSEYVPEVVAFIEQIVRKGFAYETDGSVYFDTAAFDADPKHDYAKLEPGSKGNTELVEEGEGALADKQFNRKAKSDFVLWKASKAGEPFWPSPWGPGRPGWHIECSVMASAVLGDNIDIHSGGIDLAFPHHDNELAQSEAYHGCGSWVNYFLHTGHLHIEGLKMSKSLKNFITIDEILQRYSARQLRLLFLTFQWNAKVDFSESVMGGEVRTIESTFNNFFANVKAIVHQGRSSTTPKATVYHGYDQPEKDLVDALYQAQIAFRAALCDSFNTPEALSVLRDLVSRTNVYINARGSGNVNADVVENTARWVGSMLRMFGLGEGESQEIGWGELRAEGDGNREEILMPFLHALSAFRDGVRQLAISKSDNALKDILALSDKLRDVDLVPLGVALDDQDDGKALVKLVNPAELIRARDEKRAAADAKAVKKAAQVEEERKRRIEKLEKGRIPPQEKFRPPNVPESLYGSWDDSGLPLTDGSGAELSKSSAKKLAKELATQKKLHEDFLAWQAQEQAGQS